MNNNEIKKAIIDETLNQLQSGLDTFKDKICVRGCYYYEKILPKLYDCIKELSDYSNDSIHHDNNITESDINAYITTHNTHTPETNNETYNKLSEIQSNQISNPTILQSEIPSISNPKTAKSQIFQISQIPNFKIAILYNYIQNNPEAIKYLKLYQSTIDFIKICYTYPNLKTAIKLNNDFLHDYSITEAYNQNTLIPNPNHPNYNALIALIHDDLKTIDEDNPHNYNNHIYNEDVNYFKDIIPDNN